MAAGPREIELKLAVPAAALPRLRRRLAALGAPRDQSLETIYLDTPDRLLARHAMALRLRRAGHRWLQTLKTGDPRAAFTARGEWEQPAPGGRVHLERLAGTPLPALLAAHGEPALQPQFATRFDRRTWQVRRDSSRIEVALDRGEIVAGERREPLLELELELKAGPVQPLFALARQLVGDGRAAPLPLLPLTESKAARGYRLAAGHPLAPQPVSAASRRADRGPDAVLQATEAWLANAHGALAGGGPGFLRHARAALRAIASCDLPADLAAELDGLASAPPAVGSDGRAALASGRTARLALALLQFGACGPAPRPTAAERH